MKFLVFIALIFLSFNTSAATRASVFGDALRVVMKSLDSGGSGILYKKGLLDMLRDKLEIEYRKVLTPDEMRDLMSRFEKIPKSFRTEQEVDTAISLLLRNANVFSYVDNGAAGTRISHIVAQCDLVDFYMRNGEMTRARFWLQNVVAEDIKLLKDVAGLSSNHRIVIQEVLDTLEAQAERIRRYATHTSTQGADYSIPAYTISDWTESIRKHLVTIITMIEHKNLHTPTDQVLNNLRTIGGVN